MTDIKTHFVGIGGIGMSALAKLLLQKNQKVSGSDKNSSSITEELSRSGAEIFLGHDVKNLPEKGRVVLSTSIDKLNPEFSGCDSDKHEIMHRSDLLAELMKHQKALLVTGTHGKTTTSSLLATVLEASNLKPTWAVGGIISHFGTNASLGAGEYFVAEADESDGTHEKYQPFGLILTNLHEDHLDHYKNSEAQNDSFRRFLNKIDHPQHFFWCGDSSRLQSLNPNGISYGFNDDNDLKILDFKQGSSSSQFSICWKGETFKAIELPLLGRHNALNAAAVFGLALSLGVSESQIRAGFHLFKGAKRRLDLKLDIRKTLVFDDYAHHPNEIAATLSALKAAYPERRLLVAFQPHRFSRTRDCFNQFSTAFDCADKIFLTDIYSAGEAAIEGIDAMQLSKTIERSHYIPRDKLFEAISKEIRPFDVLVTMGAGDITKVSDQFVGFVPRKLKAACLAGGRSEEHEISLLSIKSVIEQLDRDLFDIDSFLITKKGLWIGGKKAEDYLLGKSHFDDSKSSLGDLVKQLEQCDLAFPILHGTYGEDGTMQGMLEILGVPYAGSNTESCAISMNKATSKKLAQQEGVKTASFVSFTDSDWRDEKEQWIHKIKTQLTLPLYLKPVHLGSSVGIVKVIEGDDLIAAIDTCFTYDTQVLLENSVKGREIEFSVVGKGPWFISKPGEIFTQGQMYDYENKYGADAFAVNVAAELSEDQIKKGQEVVLKIYRAIGCDGMARVDLFLTDTDEYYFNEINPIPGFTRNSLFPKMCENSGLTYGDLLSRLAELALARKVKQDRIL